MTNNLLCLKENTAIKKNIQAVKLVKKNQLVKMYKL